MTIKKKTDKDQLIENAYNLFNTRGYHNTSIADIAETCRLTKGSLYHYIASKQELGALVIDYIHNYFKENFFKIVYKDTYSLDERVLQFQKGLYDFFATKKGGCLISNLALEITNTVPEFVPKLQVFFEDWINAFEYLFRLKFPADKARSLAIDSLCQVQGAVILMRVSNDLTALKNWSKGMHKMMDIVPETVD